MVDTLSRHLLVRCQIQQWVEDVVENLIQISGQIGYPETVHVDQGSEFISRDLDLWAYQKGGVLDFSRLGKPTDNAFIESSNGKFRGRRPQYALVHEPRRRPQKTGEMAQRL